MSVKDRDAEKLCCGETNENVPSKRSPDQSASLAFPTRMGAAALSLSLSGAVTTQARWSAAPNCCASLSADASIICACHSFRTWWSAPHAQ
jgi:hypothetical protein